MVVKEAIVVGAAVPLLTGLIYGPTVEATTKKGKPKKKMDYRLLLLSGVVAAGVSGLLLSYMAGGFAVPRPSAPVAPTATKRPIMPASRVSLNKFYEEPLTEFYSNTPPYSDGHIYVD